MVPASEHAEGTGNARIGQPCLFRPGIGKRELAWATRDRTGPALFAVACLEKMKVPGKNCAVMAQPGLDPPIRFKNQLGNREERHATSQVFQY